MIDITREIAMKVRDTVDAGLVSGLGEQRPGFMLDLTPLEEVA